MWGGGGGAPSPEFFFYFVISKWYILANFEVLNLKCVIILGIYFH